MAKKVYETPPTGELGNQFSDESLFGDYENGKVFDYDAWSVRDMDEMLSRDGKAKTLEQVLTLPIRRAPWVIEPAEGDRGEAEFLREVLERPANAGGMSVPFSFVLGQATSAFVMRKAFFEKVFRVGEGDLKGKVVYDKVAWRPPSSCQLALDARTGSFAGFRQRPYPLHPDLQRKMVEWIDYEPARAWVYIHGQHRNPQHGLSDLEVAMWCYRTKQKIRYLWYSFLENQSVPRSLVQAKDLSEAKRVAQQVAKLKSMAALAMTDQVAVTPYEASGKGADQFKAAIDFLNAEMSGSVLAGFTDLTSAAADGHGSFALSKNASDFFLSSRYAVAEELAQSINNHLLSDLVRYNFGVEAKAPMFKFGQLSDSDISEALTLLGTMVGSTANNLPGEFTYELAEKVGDYLDLDVEKLHREFEKHAKEKEEQAKQMQKQMQMGGGNVAQVGKLAGAVDAAKKTVDAAKKGVKLSHMGSGRTVIDMGHHVTGTNWRPVPVESVHDLHDVLQRMSDREVVGLLLSSEDGKRAVEAALQGLHSTEAAGDGPGILALSESRSGTPHGTGGDEVVYEVPGDEALLRVLEGIAREVRSSCALQAV